MKTKLIKNKTVKQVGKQPGQKSCIDYHLPRSRYFYINWMRNLLIIFFSVILQNAFPQITFKARADYPTGNSPTSVTASDFNGDNKIDLAVTDRNTNIVSIYNGTGLGSFGPKVNFTTGVNPSNSIVGDFNADGKPDLAITNNGANTVSILLNTGSGFGTKTDFATENLPQSVETGDMNGDGKSDLVISYSNVALVSILLGDGSGGFGPRSNFASGANPRSVVVGDLNSDNKLDVVTANTNASGTVSILLGNGDGTLSPKTDYAASISPVSVAIGDLNNDGKPDLAVANNGDRKVSILLGNGDGTVGPKTDIPIGTTLTRILIEDIDKNNVQDIMLTGTFMSVLFGTGSGSFGPKNEFITNGTLVNGVIADFDGDCKPDVAAPGVNTFSVHINNGSGGFLANAEYPTGSQISDVVVGDFNEDSKSDFVTVNAGSNSISLLLGAGDGTFGAKSDFPTAAIPSGIAKGDFNGDGHLDIVTTNFTPNSMSLLLGNGLGGFGIKTDFPVGVGPIHIAVGDFNDDGNLDVVTTNRLARSISILMGTGSGSFDPKVDYTVGSVTTPWEVAVADLDGDSKQDIVVAHWDFANQLVGVFLNSGTGTFPFSTDYTTGSNPNSVAIGDFNNDGKPDLATANQNVSSRSVSILLGTGTGTFGVKTDFSMGLTSLPSKIVAGDLNNDGNLDLVTTRGTQLNVAVLLGNGTGNFNNIVQFGTGPNVSLQAIDLGDFNGDGLKDIVTENNTSSVAVILSYIATPPSPPSISSFFPLSGGEGASVVIAGSNFDPIPAGNIVAFNGVNALVTASSATSITATVPTGATTGPIEVTIGCNTINSGENFTVGVIILPAITSFTPISGPIGTSVTITGTNFSPTPANNIVYFGATRATVTAATSTQLTVTVPTGATYQPITVQVDGLTAYSNKPFVVTFAGGGSIDACSFAPRVNFATGTTPLSIYFGDLDGDGKADMVTGNQNANTISVFRNTSTSGTLDASSFAASITFSVGVQPYLIVIGDIDGDGKHDLMVPNETGGTVSVLRNTSTVGALDATSFAAKVDFVTGAGPHSVFLEDLDADGKPEMVSANFNSNTLSVLKNTSTPGVINASSFATKVDFGTGTNPQSVGIADVDGDGKPDLVVTNGNAGTNTLSVLRNTTSPGIINASSFTAKVDFTTGFYPRSLAIGDIDGDDKPDLVIANFSSNSISVLRNTSTAGSITAGSFAASVNFTTGSGPHAVSISDLDGDGMNDIVVANGGSASVGAFKNQSTPGAFTAASLAARIDFIAGFGPVNLALGDVDGDGKNDLTVSNGGANTFSVFRNLLGEISLPTVTSFTPSFGSAGTSVTINGTNFSTPFTNTVKFNGVSATITASTATSITVDVPAGVTTGLIEVTIGCNAINSSTNFVVCSPPSAPVAIHNSGCSGTSILLGATGGSPGLYLWYSVSTGGTAIPGAVNDSFTTPTLTNNASYWVTIADGPCESSRTEVIATVIPLPSAPNVTPVNPVCPGSDVTLTANGGTDGQYRWYDGAALISGEVNSTFTVTNLTSSKTFSVAIHDGTCESNKTSVTAAVQNCTPPTVTSTTATAFIEGIVTIDLEELVSDEEDNIDPSRLQITSQPTSGAFAELVGFELQINYAGFPFVGSDEVGIEACDLTDLCTQQQITIELGGDIVVYNGLSPNGDGLNEFFKIQYIDILPETQSNQVIIYNRWGDEVFSVRDYNNDDRTFKGDSNSGKKLPTGTYFYKVVFSSGKKTITGFLELKY